MRKLFLLGLTTLSVCVSCTQGGIAYKQPVFPVEEQARFILLTGELDYGVIEDIWETESYIVTLASEKRTHNFCHIYDKHTGELLGETFHRGRGPGEIMAGYGTFEVHNGTVRYFDFTKNSVFRFSVDSLLQQGSGAVEELKGDFLYGQRYRGTTGNYDVHLFIASGAEGDDAIREPRLKVTDKSGSVVSENDNYPEENQLANFANTYYVSLSPDGTKCAIVPCWSAVLELYDVPDLQPRHIGYFAGQEYECPTGNIKMTEKTVLHYADIYATDKSVYLASGGEVPVLVNQSLPEEERKLLCDKIDIFNWKGRPLRRIVTDYRICKLCVDAGGKHVYAIVQDRMGTSYLAYLEL